MDLVLRLLVVLRTDDERRQALEVLFTPSEIKKLEGRIRVVQLLLSGKSQREVCAETGSGIATVSRAARNVQSFGSILGLIDARLKQGACSNVTSELFQNGTQLTRDDSA